MSISLTALFAMMREDPKGAAALWKDSPILQFDKKELAMIMSGLSSLQLTRKDIKALIATRQTVRKTGKMTFSKDTLSKITVNTFGKMMKMYRLTLALPLSPYLSLSQAH